MNLDGSEFVPLCRSCGRVLDEANLPDPDLEDGLAYCLDEPACERLRSDRMRAADEAAERRRA